MPNHILSALKTLTTGSVVKTSMSASSGESLRQVECTDGTIFKLGDEVADEIACYGHGGVKFKANKTAND